MIDYTEDRKDMQLERKIDDFFAWAEAQAKEKEVTVDYFLEEFFYDH